MAQDRNGPAADHNLPEYSVGEISTAIKRALESGFAHVRVRGEVSGFKRAASGHLYFALKDADAVLDAVCWKGTAGRLAVAPEDGLEVVATGRITAYAGRSRYQIVVEAIELAGEGALLKLLEERRRKLAAEGLFDESRKRPLPFLPDVIGVVTSPTGAVIRDILHRLAERFPRRVLIWPVLVQGDGAADRIAAAIDGFNALPADGPVPRPDVLIVARGGGSLEDLWAFNEENVVRAAASSAIPLIAAVGHETDWTLIDHAADRRAPTPTAAAEMAVPVRAELLAQTADAERRLVGAGARLLDDRRLRLDGLARGLPRADTLLESALQTLDDRRERLRLGLVATLAAAGHALDRLPALQPTLARFLREKSTEVVRFGDRLRPEPVRDMAGRGRERLVELTARMAGAGRRTTDLAARRLDGAGALLDSFSYQRVLERGFVLVRDRRDRPVTAVAAAKPGLDVRLTFHDGEAAARIAGPGGGRAAAAGKKRPDKGKQGSLL